MLFPDLIGTRRSFAPLFSAASTGLGESYAQFYRKALFPRWEISVAYEHLTTAERQAIADHNLAVEGATTEFDWCDWRTRAWFWVPIAKGDGTTTVFDLPGKELSDAAFFTGAGTSATGTIAEGAGADGRARVTVTAPVTNNTWLWLNARMKRYFTVRHARTPDKLTRDLESGLWMWRATFLQVKD